MARYLHGLHDIGGEHLHGDKPGWTVDVVSLSEVQSRDYRHVADRGIGVICRLNWAWHPHGTLPDPAQYGEMARRCRDFVASSPGCSHWIVGNEFNHPMEHPDGRMITPEDAAHCHKLVYAAIKQVQPHAKVLVGAVAPWNVQSGDWLQYLRRLVAAIGNQCDGYALHAYTHGADPALVTSETVVNGWFWHFRTYRQQIEQILAVRPEARNAEFHITETNQGDDAWADRNSGWVQAAMQEIHGFNQLPNQPKVLSVCLYRWPKYDMWHIEGKSGVIDDFRAAVARGYQSPQVKVSSQQQQTFIPTVSTGVDNSPSPQLPSREWSEDFRQRVPHFTPTQAQPGQRGYWLVEAQYAPNGAALFGPDHHILVDVLDTNGKRQTGVPVHFYWADGAHVDRIHKTSEPYGVDFPMHAHGHSYGVWVGDARDASDDVFGMGLGTIEQPDWNHHVSYYLVFREVVVPEQAQQQPTPDPVQTPGRVPPLAHPVQDPQHRIITQPFGARPEVYSQYSVDGVPLRGHEGVDFGTPTGSRIVAVDGGIVIEAGDQGGMAYGKYIKLIHPWGESVYAHLSQQLVQVGQTVSKGQVIGLSGYSGNVEPPGPAGAHLHFGLRVNPYDRRDGWGGYTDPLPYLNGQAARPEPMDILMLIKAAAAEFGLDADYFTSMIYAESKFDPNARSGAGAMGLAQITPPTWAEWSARVGAGADPYDARQNLRVGAAYLRWCLEQVGGDRVKALVAYNFGIGNVLSGKETPLETRIYAYSVVHGADLLKVVGA